MATVAQIQQEMTELQAQVTAIGDATQAAVTLLSGLSAIIAALRQALQDAQNAGAQIPQSVIDQFDAVEAELASKTQALAAAITANTPSA